MYKRQTLQLALEIARRYNVTIVLEPVNSAYEAPNTFMDNSALAFRFVDDIQDPHLKVLYDIYHMQIMEGNIIENIRKYHPYFSHVHTGGSPGRAEIDETQELYYPAIIKALMETGYKGFVGQEFVPAQEDKIASLEKCIRICDV